MITLKELYKPRVYQIDGKLKISSTLPDNLSEIYHENTKMHASDVRPWLVPILPSGLSAMPVRTFFQRSARSYKKYRGYPAVKLETDDEAVDSGSLWDVIASRRCKRDYSDTPIRIQDLSKILRYGYGETGRFCAGGNEVCLRATPSAGALYPLDIYPLIENVSDIDKGLYHYNIEDNELECLRSGSFLKKVYHLVQPSNNNWIASAGAVLFLTATFKRNQLKYGDRGYRGVLLDAGHLSQNILLGCTALGYSACIIVACLDDPVNDFLNIDGIEESILFAISIGSPDMEKTNNAE